MFARGLKYLLLAVLCLALYACGATSGYNDIDPPRRHPVYYITKSGDSVSSIASRFKVSPASIILLNDIDNPQRLQSGSKIMVGYRMPKAGGDGEDVQMAKASIKTSKPVPVPKENNEVTPKQSSNSSHLGWPVLKGTVVSPFGPRGGTFHDGIDIACPSGTPVYASHSGRVMYADDGLDGYGELVIVRHNRTGFTSVYAHNSKLRVSEGDEVKKGQQIADSGNTGKSSGPHVHYEIRVKDANGRYVAVDPLPILLDEDSKNPSYRINDNLTPLLVKRTN